MEPALARYIWQLIEPFHAIVYFAPDAVQICERAGFKGGWMGYFACRSAAMGAVGPEVVTATFYNFHPAMVARAIPDAWRFSTPEKALAARLEIADGAIRRTAGASPDVEDAADLLARVVSAGTAAGRPLFAANAATERPDTPHLALWWACTALREHRGDGHVACLTAADLDGCEAHVVSAAVGAVKPETQQLFRGWSEDEWAGAEGRLRDRGLLNGSGGLSPEGGALKERIEEDTDRLAAAPYSILSAIEIDHLVGALERITEPFVAQTFYPNPMGLTPPDPPAV
jgi:hypothetical protein